MSETIVQQVVIAPGVSLSAVPPNGTGTVFRVRIGTFKTKREAETIAAKLQKEEQIKPWVTR